MITLIITVSLEMAPKKTFYTKENLGGSLVTFFACSSPRKPCMTDDSNPHTIEL